MNGEPENNIVSINGTETPPVERDPEPPHTRKMLRVLVSPLAALLRDMDIMRVRSLDQGANYQFDFTSSVEMSHGDAILVRPLVRRFQELGIDELVVNWENPGSNPPSFTVTVLGYTFRPFALSNPVMALGHHIAWSNDLGTSDQQALLKMLHGSEE